MLHAKALEKYGGCDGIRDPNLIDSAVASARKTYCYGSNDLFDTAASYAFHFAENQPYVDGNKRTAVSMAIAFLHSNQIELVADEEALYNAMIAIAEKRMDKIGLAEVFRRLAKKTTT